MYNVNDWYWIVAGDGDSIFSSKAGTTVPADDATYSAWLTRNKPTKIPDYADLYWVLQNQTPTLAALAVPFLLTKNALTPPQIIAALLQNGLQITSTATSSLDGLYAIDDSAQNKITAVSSGINAGHLPEGQTTVGVIDMTGVVHLFSAADYINFAEAAEDYIYKLHITEATLLAGGSATWPPNTATIA